MSSSPTIVYAIHDFEAENEDEMTFQYGEPIVILEKDDQYLDGWWQGRNTLGETGLFPMNYTSPEKPMMHNRSETYNNEIFANNRLSSGTSSASSSEGCRISTANSSLAGSSEDLQSPKMIHETFGVSNTSPLQWNMEDVVTWLESVGLETVVDNFIDQDITGDVLVNLDHEALKELGITAYGRRYKIMNAIKNLKATMSCSSPVESIFQRHSGSGVLQGRYGSVTEKMPKKSSSISSLNSSVSSPRSVIMPSNLSYMDSLSHSSASSRNDAHLSYSYAEPSPMLNNLSSISAKRVTYDSTVPQRGTATSTLTDIGQAPASTSEAPSCTFPEYEGWIYKQSDRYKTWNKRWFVLYGNNLFYFKSPKDTRMKGIIHLRGYRVVLETSSNASNKKYYFKLHHDTERTFFFYTTCLDEMKMWAQALMKSTIERDLCVPVVSSNTIETIPLDLAQKMKPRPPSIAMFLNKDRQNQNYLEAIKNDVLTSSLEEELDETLLWMEHPGNDQNEETYQKLIIRSYPSSPDNLDEVQEQEGHITYFHQESDTEQVGTETDHLSNSNNSSNDAVLYWVNSCLKPTQVHDLGPSFRSGEILIQLLETLSGQTIPRSDSSSNSPSSSMSMLDNIVEAFKFMNRKGVINNGYTIKDVFSGNEDKIADMILSIKIWSEEDKN